MNKTVDIEDIKMEKEKKYSIYFLSFLLPLILILAIYIAKQVFPFGDRCILRTDFYHQYLPFYTELQDKLKHFESLLYTYGVGLGTNFITLMAYYLVCPFNILLLFISENFVIEFMTVMIMLKIALSGFTMSYYLVNKYKTDSLIVVFFAIFYAMSGYVGAYYWNIMWLNNIVLFPLLMYGFERQYNGCRPYLYIITLAASLLCNYYIGAITCVFIFVYFIFYAILSSTKLLDILKKLFYTGIHSIAGVLISCVFLVPIIYAFKTTASSDTTFPSSSYEYFSIIEVLSRHLPFAKVENGIEYWPNIYVGVFSFGLIALYLLSKKYHIKEKICYMIFLLFFIASFSINIFDYLWHLCKFPNSLPCRQSFIYIFIILVIAIKPMLKLNSVKKEHIVLAFSIPIVFILLASKDLKNEKVEYYSIYGAIIFLFVYMIIFLCYKNKKYNKNLILYVSVIFICFEAFMNMYHTSITTIKRSDYTKNAENMRAIVKGIDNITDDFYRVEKFDMRTKNDGAFLHFPSASIFSSSTYADGSAFYEKFGMEASTNAYSTTGSTPLTKALLSIKYEVNENENPNAKEMNKRLIADDGTVYLYENIDTMPLSYVLDEEFLAEYDIDAGNPATVQNNFTRGYRLPAVLDKKNIKIDGKKATYTTDIDGSYYVFVRDKSIRDLVVTLPKTTKTFKYINRGYFADLGYLKAGTPLEFRNDYNDSTLLMELFSFNYDTLKGLCSELNANSDFTLNKLDTTYINYNINSNINGLCVVTLPYDEGFTLYVDGKKTEINKLWDFFISFNVTEGMHTVELKYVPQGFMLGVILSIIGLVMVISIYVVEERFIFKKNKGGV